MKIRITGTLDELEEVRVFFQGKPYIKRMSGTYQRRDKKEYSLYFEVDKTATAEALAILPGQDPKE